MEASSGSDIFVSHASEDKEAVARPLAQTLVELGWKVWLDELELTIGDSLSGRIDAALVGTRFGVVVLSPAFFGKAWAERELAGLAAREVGSGRKVILPVWHEVDHAFVARHSPVLADRLGALTSGGISNVAAEISRAIEKSDGAAAPDEGSAQEESPLPEGDAAGLVEIPTSREAQRAVVAERPVGWEYRLYAGALLTGQLELEGKWLDHELKLAKGPRRDPDPDRIVDFMQTETGWVRRKLESVNTVFDQQLLERAFGVPGEAGNPTRIEHVAGGVLHIYESMLDWAASLRNVAVPRGYEDLLELTARLVDGPLHQIRDFIQLFADEVAQIEIRVAEAEKADRPVEIRMTLTLALEEGLEEELSAALENLA